MMRVEASFWKFLQLQDISLLVIRKSNDREEEENILIATKQKAVSGGIKKDEMFFLEDISVGF